MVTFFKRFTSLRIIKNYILFTLLGITSDDAYVFLCVEKTTIKVSKNKNFNGISPTFFAVKGEGKDNGMSIDFDFLSSPEESRQRRRVPANNAVIRFKIKDLKSLGLNVKHKPLSDIPNKEDNFAHGLVVPKEEIIPNRNKLRDISEWVIKIDN